MNLEAEKLGRKSIDPIFNLQGIEDSHKSIVLTFKFIPL